MRLIKHDIMRRAHQPSSRIEDEICLRTLGVPDEDPDATPVGELVDVAELFHKCSATEHQPSLLLGNWLKDSLSYHLLASGSALKLKNS
jgi:hypothetical protein